MLAYLSSTLCQWNLYQKSYLQTSGTLYDSLNLHFLLTQKLSLSQKQSLPSQVSPEHVHSLATFQMSRIMFRAFQNSLRLANSPGFPFKIPARLLFAPTEITALSSGGVANSCYCFRKALEVGFFFPQLC